MLTDQGQGYVEASGARSGPAGDEGRSKVDVVVVGCGPGGEVVASLLGQAGLRVLVVDKAAAPYGQPRMSTLDGEIARVLQHAANPAEAMVDAIKAPDILLFGADGKWVPPIDWDYRICGHWSHYSLHQPNIEAAMEKRIHECPSVELRWATRAVGLEQDDECVRVTLETVPSDGSPAHRDEVVASYVLGFDGASSFVREAVGIEVDVLREHDDQWILTDFDALRPLPEIATRTQYHMDPRQPYMEGPNGANRCRTDVRVMEGQDLEELLADESYAYDFMQERFGLGRDDLVITRRVTYRFRSQIARTFRAGRVFIGGDAAHAMTPYMGQGACCAMRDAANLAWKLRLVLSGVADPALLDSYELERRPHSAFFVHGSLAVFDYVNQLDPQAAAARDTATRNGEIEFPEIPGLVDGVIRRNRSGEPAAYAGALAPQGVVRRGADEALLDDLVGYGGQLITARPARGLLGEQRLARLAELGVLVLHIAEAEVADLVDADGTYRDFWAESGAAALLARADHYLFGVASDDSDLLALVDEFLDQVPPPPTVMAGPLTAGVEA